MVAPTTRGAHIEILESGGIALAYRPRAENRRTTGIHDLERIYAILHPDSVESPPLPPLPPRYRVLVVGRKRAPRTRPVGPPYWGLVTRIADTPGKIAHELGREEYYTRARGRRIRPAARPCGDGVYSIARHGDHTHLTYALNHPNEPGPVRRALHIEPEGSYILSIKNPARAVAYSDPSHNGPGATYPERLQDRFDDRRFIPADTTDFLDFEGTQILLLATEDAAADGFADKQAASLNPAEELTATASLLRELARSRDDLPKSPLYQLLGR